MATAGVEPPPTSEEQRRVATAQLAALFEAEAEQDEIYERKFMEELKRLLAAGAADLDVRIGNVTPLLQARAAGAAKLLLKQRQKP
jgi:hypothetical protein